MDSAGARLAVWAAECFQTVESVTDTPGRAIIKPLMSSEALSAPPSPHAQTHTYTHSKGWRRWSWDSFFCDRSI